MIDWLRKEFTEPEIELGGRRVPIVLKRHARAKRLTLRMAPDGDEVRITLPQWARSAEAIAFAHARREWLESQMSALPGRNPPIPGATIRYRGEPLRIEWAEDAPRRPKLDGDSIVLGGPLEGLERRLGKWLERQALTLFEQDVRHYCEAGSIEPVKVAITRAKRRWGSCSTAGCIRMNWRLIQAPDHVRRSVAAHEVAHLVHFDHSPAFHALLHEIYEGDIRGADGWLKVHGRTLYASFG